ncbi:aldo/keto reductase [Gryllotalpicola reticulitermitis]|uniref:Aldo/keto reductase n=1 Tax=Gryllotalpicola reticulitermitis TaxID=1184153 RepID=A0ABV8Q3X1_9MICO
MSDYSPVGARAHVGSTGRGAIEAAVSAEAALFAADDDAATRPISIIAERKLGESGLAVFPFGLGTARLAAIDEVAAGRILHRFAVRGGGLYDVGDEDGSGRSQQVVGDWFAANRPGRVFTALTPSPERDGGAATGSTRIVRAVEAALRRLRLDHIDLLTLDFRDGQLTLDEQLGAVAELISAGKVRHLGANAASGDQLMAARVLSGDGLPRIVAARLAWDITGNSALLEDVRMVAAAQELALLPDATSASIALASPSLPQKVLAGWGHTARLGQIVNARVVRPERERATDAFAGRGREHRIGVALDRVSDELGLQPATTQLAWLLAKRGVVAPIVRITRPEQLDVLMDAAAVSLSRAQLRELDRAAVAAR